MSEVEKKEESTVEKTETTTTTATTEAVEQPAPTTTEEDKKGGDDDKAADEEPNVEFTPTLKLEEVKTIVTNEENETVLHEVRAKLFRFDTDPSPQWKERGTGNVRFLKDKDSGRIRIVMRREKTFKVCLNHHLSPALSLGEMQGSDKSWVWKCPLDFSDEDHPNGIAELFAIRFGTPENANIFKTKFEECQDENEVLEKKE